MLVHSKQSNPIIHYSFQAAKYFVQVGGILLCISPCDGSTDITAEIRLRLVDPGNRELPRNISTRKIGHSLDVVLPLLQQETVEQGLMKVGQKSLHILYAFC